MAMLGLGVALAGGVGLAWLRDLADPSVKSPSHLARKSPIPVLTPCTLKVVASA
jgi:capsular polysaccharide biosynthesis protein